MANAEFMVELEARLLNLRALFARGASAEEILPLLYWPDVVAAGEGLGQIYRGIPNLLPLAGEYVASMGRDCTWTLTDPVVSSDTVASTMLKINCHYDDGRADANYYALYVWERRGDEWKVAQEFLCVAGDA
jgi:hypothetical protein